MLPNVQPLVITALSFLAACKPNDSAQTPIELLKCGQSAARLDQVLHQIAEKSKCFMESIEAILKPLDFSQLRQAENSSESTSASDRLETPGDKD
jgi:hypothetical protein